MVKTTPISKYTELSDRELIVEAQRLRYEIDNPHLGWKSHFNNIFLSMIGAGTTVSTFFGLAHMYAKPDKKDLSVENVREFVSLLRGRPTDDYSNFKDYKKDHKNFANSLLVTASSFALSTIISMPIINQYQKKEHSEDSATKLSHAERILAERGYESTAQSRTSITR